MNYDIIIIGSGITGLITSAVLAKEGKKVLLLEKEIKTAPLIRSFTRKGFYCEPGFHYTGGFEERGILTGLFRYLGISERIKAVPFASDYYDIIKGSEFDPLYLPSGFRNLREYLTEQFPESRKAIEIYLDKILYIRKNDHFFNLDLPFGAYPDEIMDEKSLRDVLMADGAEELLINILGHYGKALYGSGAEEIPFGMHALIIGTFYNGPFSIKGGGLTLAETLSERIRELGVTVVCGAEVSGLDIKNRVFKGVETAQGEYYSGEICLSTIHPQLLPGLLPAGEVKPAFLHRIEKLENSESFCVGFYGLERNDVPEVLKQANLYSFEDFRKTDRKKDLCIINLDSEKDPDRKKSLSVLHYTDPCLFREFMNGNKINRKKYNDIKSEIMAANEESLYREIPGLRGKTQFLDISTPVSYQQYTGTVDGAIYGIKQSVKYRNLGTRAPVRGLYLAGQSIIPGIMGGIISGILACSNIIDFISVWDRLRK